MKTPSRPAIPNARETADTQQRYSTQAAQQTQRMGMVNQSTPYGSLSWNQTGTWEDGAPRYQATTSLSPQGQALYETNMGTAQTLASRIQQNASNPFSLDSEAEARLIDLSSRRLDPMLAARRTATESDLLNRGITMGSEAYNAAMRRDDEAANDARNQVILTGYQQGVNNALAERQLPIQEMQAVLGAGGGQVPQFQPTPQASVAVPDYQGAVGQQYQAELNDYNQRLAQQQAAMGGVFGLGGTLLGGWLRGGFGR